MGTATLPKVESLSDRDIEARRRVLLKRAGMSFVELRERGLADELSQVQQAILRQLEELDFLAGH